MTKKLLTLAIATIGLHPIIASTNEKIWEDENLYPDNKWKQSFLIDKLLYREQSTFQDILIFDNSSLGKVLMLDGVLQTTQKDEYIYHEMITHTAILANGNAKSVLIIGGGDGGSLREVLRHSSIEKVTMVDLDETVISACKQYLPMISQGAFDDPRTTLLIQDGIDFVKTTKEKFDVIICDTTDPIGPGMVLFTQEFYGACNNVLAEGGILVTQNGVPFSQEEEFVITHKNRSHHFKYNTYYFAPVPTYIGGFMAFGFATNDKSNLKVSKKKLSNRMKNINGKLRYYTPSIHKASFAMPKNLEDLLKTN
jgi:spermidine synthase